MEEKAIKNINTKTKDLILPAVAMRGLVCFPRFVMHFDVAREMSVKAVEAALKNDRLVFLTAQKDVYVEEPQEKDLYNIGVVAEIRQTLKTPDNVMRVLVEGLYRAKIKEASHLLLELVNEVLDMSKLESDEVVLEEIPFNLNSIFEEILGVIEHMAAEQNIRIIWEEKEVTHWNLIGSPVHVKRILMNILSNAVKYNKENGYVYISCREIPSKQTAMPTLEFVCRDTGIGMTEAFQKRIFEPFAQEHAGSRTKFAGTGLGMPITKKLVEKMGGTISFESKEGTGTTFVIRIPFRIDTDMKDRTEAEEKTETSIQGLHVLLTEDNELNMEIAEFVLQNEGAVVTKAWNGQKAVDIFRKSRPGEFDAILMDIMMPVMNGYEAAKMIRSLDREDAKVIPIIAMTANAFTEDKMRAKEAGMDEHIAKPVDGKLLVKVINELVKRNQREKL